MKVGLVARADRTGLAALTWEFWRNMRPDKTLVINPTWAGSGQHVDPDMYRDFMVMNSGPYPDVGMIEDPVVDQFLDELDVVFTSETPYNYWLFERARQRGVKTVLQYMFEFLDWPFPSGIPMPDLFAAPSLWRWDDVPLRNKVYLPVPVNRDALPYRRRESLRTLLHTAGTGAPHDRNGTRLLVEAMRLLPRDVNVKLTISSHRRLPKVKDKRIRTEVRVMDRYTELYRNEDAFVMPRKYGGLCLPLNEAAACGMPVIMTDIPPQSAILPGEALVPASYVEEFMMRKMIKVYETTPRAIADKIAELYYDPGLVARLSDASDAYADSISWDRMRPVYRRVFEDLL